MHISTIKFRFNFYFFGRRATDIDLVSLTNAPIYLVYNKEFKIPIMKKKHLDFLLKFHKPSRHLYLLSHCRVVYDSHSVVARNPVTN